MRKYRSIYMQLKTTLEWKLTSEKWYNNVCFKRTLLLVLFVEVWGESEIWTSLQLFVW